MVASPESAHRAAQAFPRNLGEELEEAQRELLEELGREARARASSGIAAASARAMTTENSDPPALVFATGAQVTPTARASDLFWGSEYGGQGSATTQQFPPFRSSGYWLTPAIEKFEKQAEKAVLEAVQKAWRQMVRKAE